MQNKPMATPVLLSMGNMPAPASEFCMPPVALLLFFFAGGIALRICASARGGDGVALRAVSTRLWRDSVQCSDFVVLGGSTSWHGRNKGQLP